MKLPGIFFLDLVFGNTSVLLQVTSQLLGRICVIKQQLKTCSGLKD